MLYNAYDDMSNFSARSKHQRCYKDPIEPIATHEGEQQQPQIENVPNVKTPRMSQRVRKLVIPADYEVYTTEEFQMEEIPPHLKKP